MEPTSQQEKIINFDKNSIVISNPGTGKTTTLSWKVMKLLEKGVKPEDILCITFTEKAKKEMFDKILEMSKGVFLETEIMKLNIHTFHGFAYSYLTDAGIVSREIVGNNAMRFSILGSYENNKAFTYEKEYLITDIVPKSENAMRYIKSFGVTHDKIDIKKASKIISSIHGKTNTSYSVEELQAFLKYFVTAYKDYEGSKHGAVDYSDMLLIFIEKFRGKKFQHVLVDEMQDMNELEAKIVQMVGENIFLVGDAKQAIFGFQGGSVKNFERFRQICTPMLLSENRRSTQQILDYSKENFLGRTSSRKEFEVELASFDATKAPGNNPKIISTRAHLTQIKKIIDENKDKTVAIITRRNSQIIEISQFLDSCHIPYSSTTSQATTEMAKQEIISYLKGLLYDKIEYKISSTFTIFSPYTLKESFEMSKAFKADKNSSSLDKIRSLGISFKREDVDRTFDDVIYPLCVSKGSEWFSTAITIKMQVDEYLSLSVPTIDGLFDFIAIAEESYTERNIDSKVILSTVHKAKGRDFDVVVYLPISGKSRTSFIDIVVQSILESCDIEVKKEMEEESLRIDFVAFTRAKEKLFVITDDKEKSMYYVENFSEIEMDSTSENTIAVKMDSRLSEAFALFIEGRFEESKKMLTKEDDWLEQYIINYFKSIPHLSYSSVKTDPYEFLKSNIIRKPTVSAAAEFGTAVHDAIQSILENNSKIDDYKDDVRKAVQNGLDAIEDLKKQFAGLKFLKSEQKCDMRLNSIISHDENDPIILTGKIDTVFAHNDGYLLVDYKTNKNSNQASDHKRQLSVYRKLYSKLNGIPEDRIKIFVIYVSLRGGVNTGKFDGLLEKENRNGFPTFEEHIRKVLEWRHDPKKFIQDLLDKPHDEDLLYLAIKEKLLHQK